MAGERGSITAADGDRASFRGLAAAAPAAGTERFRDHGPGNAFRVVSTSVDALTCASDAPRASVFGAAKLNSGGSVQYRIDLTRGGGSGGKPSYRIRLDNGYDSGAQRLRHGIVFIHIH